MVDKEKDFVMKDKQTAEEIVAHWDHIADHTGEKAMKNGGEHVMKMVMLAAKGLGVA